jgi:hypothetical protein
MDYDYLPSHEQARLFKMKTCDYQQDKEQCPQYDECKKLGYFRKIWEGEDGWRCTAPWLRQGKYYESIVTT